jgi:hypothetical protein
MSEIRSQRVKRSFGYQLAVIGLMGGAELSEIRDRSICFLVPG